MIAKKHSNKICLQKITESIHQNCSDFKMPWITRNENLMADKVIKTIDYDDWQTTFFFSNLSMSYGKFLLTDLQIILTGKLQNSIPYTVVQEQHKSMIFQSIGEAKTIMLSLHCT